MSLEPCQCCNGAGLQRDTEGLLRRCPGCAGSGRWESPASYTPTPVPQHINSSDPEWQKVVDAATRVSGYPAFGWQQRLADWKLNDRLNALALYGGRTYQLDTRDLIS